MLKIFKRKGSAAFHVRGTACDGTFIKRSLRTSDRAIAEAKTKRGNLRSLETERQRKQNASRSPGQS